MIICVRSQVADDVISGRTVKTICSVNVEVAHAVSEKIANSIFCDFVTAATADNDGSIKVQRSGFA